MKISFEVLIKDSIILKEKKVNREIHITKIIECVVVGLVVHTPKICPLVQCNVYCFKMCEKIVKDNLKKLIKLYSNYFLMKFYKCNNIFN